MEFLRSAGRFSDRSYSFNSTDTLCKGGKADGIETDVEDGIDGKIKGIAAGVPGGSISLNATGNSTTEFQVTFGSPSIAFPVILTPITEVKIDDGTFPATLSNGDADLGPG